MTQKKLDGLKKKQAQLTARIQQLEATEKNRERKRQTRRKILVGAYFIDKMTQENRLEELKNHLNDYLQRNIDRALFDLPEKKS